MKSKLELRLQNIKLIKDLDLKIESGQIIAIQGMNGVGKTSVVLALVKMIEGKNTKDELTHGETYGGKDLLYTNPDGDKYRVTVEYKEGQAPSMTLIRPDLSKSKRITDLRSIFNYSSISPESFMALGATKPGRARQAEMLIGLMDEQIQTDISNLKGTIATNYDDRRDLGVLIKGLPIEEPTETDLKLAESYPEWKVEHTKNQEEYNASVIDKHTRGGEIVRLGTDVEKLETAILRMQEELIRAEASLEEKTELLKTKKETPLPDTDKMKVDIDTESEMMESARVSVEKVRVYNENHAAHQAKQIKYDILTTEIDNDRKNLNIIIAKNIPVDNLVIQEDELMFVDSNGTFPFSEDNLSYSRGLIIVAKTMLALNKDVPLVTIGKAAELDNSTIKELMQLAKDKGCMIIIDKVLPSGGPLEVKILEE